MDKQQPTLSLRVLNSNKLESGKAASCMFDTQGGMLGSNENNTWAVQDLEGSISASHIRLEWRDGAFCILVLSTPIRINNSALSGSNGYTRLQQGDSIELGNLQIKVHIGMNSSDLIDPLTVSPESLVSSYSNPLDAMFDGVKNSHHSDEEQYSTLAPTVAQPSSQDPLRVLETESLTTLDDNLLSNNGASLLKKGRYRSPTFSSPLSDAAKDNAMDKDFIDLPEINTQYDIDSHLNEYNTPDESETLRAARMDKRYVAISPLMRGMDSSLPLSNTQEANEFLEEVGKTLRAAVKGLLELHQVQNGLSDKHLRPIEDNPLRLNMDYDTTLSVLFADQKSPVHLAAPAAVAESLHNMRLHHEANRTAITHALSAMLDAFSPQSLLRRFANYRRSSERSEMDSSWAWEMYRNYYDELESSRQQGLEKLFWEVYDQAYDLDLRRRQRESEK